MSAPGSAAYVQLEGVSKRFGDFVAVDAVSLQIERGEIFCLLGASGSGKTTLLRLLAGLETPNAGRLLLDGEDITAMPPYRRPLNMMFQSYALFPHLSVERNVAFGLEQERLPKSEIARRVGEILETVRMAPYRERRPHQLSGGQRQRVALARALVKRPKLLLLDEPLGALDRKLREHTQFELINLQQQVGVTFIVVTHDQEEAMTLATRIGVMDHGRVVQVGTPRQIYRNPATRFVADFIGSVNLFEGHVLSRQPGRLCLQCAELPAPIVVGDGVDDGDDSGISGISGISGDRGDRGDRGDGAAVGAALWIALRPEQIRLSGEAPAQSENWARGVIREVAYRGELSVFLIRLDGGRELRATLANSDPLSERRFGREAAVYLTWTAASAVVGRA